MNAAHETRQTKPHQTNSAWPLGLPTKPGRNAAFSPPTDAPRWALPSFPFDPLAKETAMTNTTIASRSLRAAGRLLSAVPPLLAGALFAPLSQAATAPDIPYHPPRV
jgi:hypothetical protein